jgi:hypothetical protein
MAGGGQVNLRDLIGKFIVIEERKLVSPNGDLSPVAVSPVDASATPPDPTLSPLAEDFDFSAIYRQAGILPAAFLAEQALEILDSLPKELSSDTKNRAARELLLTKSTMAGVPAEAVGEDARCKVEALTAAAEGLAEQVSDFSTNTESDIANLQEQIVEKRRAIEQAQTQEKQIAQKCRTEAERLKAVAQIFSSSTGPRSESK